VAGTQYPAYVPKIVTERPKAAAQFRSGMQNKAINTVYAHSKTKDNTALEEAIKLTWGESTTGATQFET